ncbi:hypothetical protein [Candidatus Berkiella aquae]|uniref:Uncharacterized protein n=1 Tax=Candidatus Berkiella aquae TaxID=295108 RepID=A0A0Q9YUJ4_9GAMM|nr:hypothetical protein [Candidatus Berkiella aquae]MCS5710781.1 hypothetical protein [Candidatus Berkiella aquae]
MASTSHTKQNPFSAYVYDFDELLKKLQQASNDSEVSQLLHEINKVLADYFKSMMALCEEQHQHLFELAEENRDKYSEKAKKAFDHVQTDLAKYIKQARELNQAYWDKAKEPLKLNPHDFMQTTFVDFQKNVTDQVNAWQEMSQTHSKEWIEELENIQSKASDLFNVAEKNHQALLAQYHELETRLKAVLNKRNANK